MDDDQQPWLREFLPEPYICICVNCPIWVKEFQWIWQNARFRICADGGATQLLQWCRRYQLDPFEHLPHFLIGDMDSLDSESRHFFLESPPVRSVVHFIQLSDDQESTDLEKCLRFEPNESLSREYSEAKSNCTIVIGGLDGRVDHTLASLNAILKPENLVNRVIIVNRASMAWALTPNHQHQITIDNRWMGPACGILPIGMPSRVTTSGLEWNLCKDMILFP